MSTKVSLDYNSHTHPAEKYNDSSVPPFRLYQECLDDSGDVYLEITDAEFIATPDSVMVRIPRKLWNRIVAIGPIKDKNENA